MFVASVVAQLFGGTLVIGLFPLVMLSIMASLGWSRTQMGGMAGVTVLSAAVGLPIWGYWVDRYGARLVVLRGTALTALAIFALAGLKGSLLQGFSTFALAGFASSTSVGLLKAQALRFNRYRGRVLAALGMTVGVSFGLTPLLGKLLLDAYGWRSVYAAFAMLPLCIGLPLLFVWFRGEAAAAKQGSALSAVGLGISTALRKSRFWMIVFMSAASAFVFAGMQAHFIPFLQERGLGSQDAVYVLSFGVMAGLLCQLLTGWLLDHWKSPRAGAPFIAVALVGMFLLWYSRSTSLTVSGAILLQGGVGGELSMFPYLISRTFGTAHLARIVGTVMLISQVISSGAPLMMGVIHDHTGNYGAAPPVFAALLALSLCVLLMQGKSFHEPTP